MTRIVLVRHGEALCNVEHRIEGLATCRGLSPRGIEQAGTLAARFGREGFRPDAVVSSPILRARQTAELLAAPLAAEVSFDPDLEEIRPGEAEGMTWDQYFAFYGSAEGWEPEVPFAPGAEAWCAFAARVSGALDRIGAVHEERTVLVVAHGGVVDASMFHYFRLDPQVRSPIDFETANTSLTEWERRSFPPLAGADDPVRRWRLVRYNDAAHLAAHDAPPSA